MDYKTFTNELDKNIILVNIEAVAEVEANVEANVEAKANVEVYANVEAEIKANVDKECIICLEKTHINNKDHITLMNEMYFLIKKCDCQCYAHHKCIEKWIDINPVCPICKGEILFPVTSIKNKEFIIDLHGIQGNRIPINLWSSYFCIRMIILLFLFLIIIQIILHN